MLSKFTFLKIFLLSLLFTGALFGLQTYLSFNFSDTLAEENYIEKSIYDDIDHNHTEQAKDIETIPDIIQQEPKDIPTVQDQQEPVLPAATPEEIKQIYFNYIPTTLRTSIRDYRDTTRSFIGDDTFDAKIQKLTVEFHEEMIDVRGKMKNKTIKIFDPLQMESSEFLALFTHEFAHYLDLYYFSKSPFGDISEDFYAISWESTKTMKRGQSTGDFVSGYAMTNKYEDFAETLTYYIFHNKDFEKKTQTSQALLWKYKFLNEKLFKDQSFVSTDFSPNNKVKSYYWDITKIDIDDENFLQYLKNDI